MQTTDNIESLCTQAQNLTGCPITFAYTNVIRYQLYYRHEQGIWDTLYRGVFRNFSKGCKLLTQTPLEVLAKIGCNVISHSPENATDPVHKNIKQVHEDRWIYRCAADQRFPTTRHPEVYVNESVSGRGKGCLIEILNV